MYKTKPHSLLPASSIQHKIYFLRDTRIMLDSDLASLYGVSTKNLNRAVKRNLSRFPSDFMFQLKSKEIEILRFQSGTSSQSVHGGRRYLPYAFTEHGIAMLSSVLHSDRAIQVNYAAKLTKWRSATTLNSKPFLPRFARCWKPQFHPNARSGSMPNPIPFGRPNKPLSN